MSTNFKLKLGVMLLQLMFFLTIQYSYSQVNSNQVINHSGMNIPDGAQFKNANLSYKLISSIESTWGYNILLDGKIFVHQPNIPGKAGNKGFENKKQAIKVAELVIKKIKMGMMPPSISQTEMKEEGITLNN